MDEKIPHQEAGNWLAVTSLSFDISVLELLWTLARGFKVVLYEGPGGAAGPDRGMEFSLFYFSSDATAEKENRYRMLMEGARYADENGFVAVWTPERHFHDFGGLYPNPAVTGAAVAAITKNVKVRAGSVVLPLHHPARVAEQWSVVDNLSGGRVEVAFATGWFPTDFLLRPENFSNPKEAMFRDIEIVQKLWQGEHVAFPGATGKSVEVKILPEPLQPKLPVWITTAGNPDTYRRAGKIGANILTHLLGQSVEDLAEKITAYREARAEAGHEGPGHISLMLHTFVGDDDAKVKETVREPLKGYLGSSLSLLKKYAWSFPAFKRPEGVDTNEADEFANLSDEERDAILEGAFNRYYETSGLLGSPKTCIAMVERLKAIGVDEIACLIDFGVPTQLTLDHLPKLNEVRAACHVEKKAAAEPTTQVSMPELIAEHQISHMQCTPSMARMLAGNDETRAALGSIKHLYLGGEALPAQLITELADAGAKDITNMYGPTETTIWSTTHHVDADGKAVPIGKPIANTQVYVLDRWLNPEPPGVPGELYIAGDGVTRGYLNRPGLTAQRFLPDPFAKGSVMYRTGDVVRWNGSGILEFLGRVDHQVKVRGFRIELGEIETHINRHPAVREAVVLAKEDRHGEPRLIAYLIPEGDAPDEENLRAELRDKLPEYMVPSVFAVMDKFPLTPNKKIDRKALPEPETLMVKSKAVYAPPENETEGKIVTLWQELLGRDRIGIDDNFFDIGGHSLLVVRMHRQLEKVPGPSDRAHRSVQLHHHPRPDQVPRVGWRYRNPQEKRPNVPSAVWLPAVAAKV